LGIVDYGDLEADYVPSNYQQRLPIGGNLAFSRAAVVAIGGWRTDLGKVNNTLISGEDHEIFMRLRRQGLYAGYYDPANTVRHFVPAHRMTPRYFRQWFYWHGKTQGIMLDDSYPELDMNQVPKIGGVPRFVYRQALQQLTDWLKLRRGGASPDSFIEELKLIKYAGFAAECWRRCLRRNGNRPLTLLKSRQTVAPNLRKETPPRSQSAKVEMSSRY
jgi:hypothetical protein